MAVASERGALSGIVAESEAMRTIVHQIAPRLAPGDDPVLIQGELGVGKKLIASLIHRLSPRSGHVCVVNCGAIGPSGIEWHLFGRNRWNCWSDRWSHQAGILGTGAQATVVLEDIDEVALDVQRALLEALEWGAFLRGGDRTTTIPLRARLIATSTQDLAAWSAADRFVPGLYRCLAPRILTVPPLRERSEDLEALVPALVAEVAAMFRVPVPHVSAALLDRLRAHPLPGNVVQLKNALEWGLGDMVTKGADFEAATLARLEFTSRPLEPP